MVAASYRVKPGRDRLMQPRLAAIDEGRNMLKRGPEVGVVKDQDTGKVTDVGDPRRAAYDLSHVIQGYRSIATSAESVTLSWPLAAMDYNPQVANDLAAPDWRPVSATDGTNGVFRTLTVPRTNQNQFYRLQKNTGLKGRHRLGE